MPKPKPYFEIRLRDESVRLYPGDFGPRDEDALRQATRRAGVERRSLTGIFEELDNQQTVGLDTIALAWWAARRKQGIREDLAGVLDRFPSYEEIGEGALEVTADDGTGTDAPADDSGDSEPAAEAADDPLGSGDASPTSPPD